MFQMFSVVFVMIVYLRCVVDVVDPAPIGYALVVAKPGWPS